MARERRKKKEDLDFFIAFFEGVLRRSPCFVEALMALAEAYTRKGLYGKGLEVDEQLVALRPQDPVCRYNIACSYSLLGRVEEALRQLRQAIELGYEDFSYMAQDPDLVNVRQDRRFQDLYKLTAASRPRILKTPSDD